MNLAHLKEDSFWFKLFPNGVPILDAELPELAHCEGDGVQEVYMVDMSRLSPEKFEQIAKLIHRQCDPSGNVAFDDMKDQVRGLGLPLRAKHVKSVTTSDTVFFL